MPKKNPTSGRYLLGAALFFLLFHFAVWPLVWHGILLRGVETENHQLRVESYFPHRISDTRLFLETPNSDLTAFAVWQVPQGGLYQFRLTCNDHGKVSIDSRPVIVVEGISPNNVGETKKWLNPGPHFLELQLNNGPEQGWLKIEVKGPGQTQYALLDPKELSSLKIGNIETWLMVITWGEYLSLLFFLGLSLLWIGRFYFQRRKERVFPSRWWKYFFLALAVVALLLSVLYHVEHPLPPIWSDGLGYYSYLPAYLIYHDLSMESLYQATRRYDYPEDGLNLHDGEGFIRYPATGRYLVKYPIGTAILMFPFFLLGHLVSPLLGFTADGFSVGYQFSIALASIFYMLAGLFILFKILMQSFSSRVVGFTLLSLFLGTNLLAYTSLELSLSHVYSFFLLCLLLYTTPRWYNDPSRINTLWLGLVAGLIPLVRNPNAVFLLFIPLYGITNWGSARERARFFWQARYRVFLLLAIILLMFSPQTVIWKLSTNQFLLKSYAYEQVYFLSPSPLKVLFSLHHGLLIWSPILVFAVAGFWTMRGLWRSYRWPIVVCLLLHLYIVSSWHLWYYGISFGHRAFVDTLGLLALPLACFLGSLPNRIVKRTVYGLSILCIALTFYWFFQYSQGVLPGEMRPYMTWPVYKKILVDPSGWNYLREWLKNPRIVNYRLMS